MDPWLDLGEQVDKLDVGGENQGSRWNRTEVELGMEQLELD